MGSLGSKRRMEKLAVELYDCYDLKPEAWEQRRSELLRQLKEAEDAVFRERDGYGWRLVHFTACYARDLGVLESVCRRTDPSDLPHVMDLQVNIGATPLMLAGHNKFLTLDMFTWLADLSSVDALSGVDRHGISFLFHLASLYVGQHDELTPEMSHELRAIMCAVVERAGATTLDARMVLGDTPRSRLSSSVEGQEALAQILKVDANRFAYVPRGSSASTQHAPVPEQHSHLWAQPQPQAARTSSAAGDVKASDEESKDHQQQRGQREGGGGGGGSGGGEIDATGTRKRDALGGTVVLM